MSDSETESLRIMMPISSFNKKFLSVCMDTLFIDIVFVALNIALLCAGFGKVLLITLLPLPVNTPAKPVVFTPTLKRAKW